MVVMPRSNSCLSVLFLPALCASKIKKSTLFFSIENKKWWENTLDLRGASAKSSARKRRRERKYG
jgi:hypothetical protein